MEFKHFSHSHVLTSHHIPPTSQVQCNGCKSPASGNLYVCWKCNYYLHDHCFLAPRSLKHPSHPIHPLTLVPFPTYPYANFICNSCHATGNAFSYSCSECEFDVHVYCAHLPHPNPNNDVPNPNFNSAIYPPPVQTNPLSYPPQTALYPPHVLNPTQQNQPANYHIPQTNIPINPTPQNIVLPPVGPTNLTPPTDPTYSTVVNATSTTPTTPTPPVTQTNPSQPNPQPKPPSIIRHFSHPHVLKAMEIDKSNSNDAKVCSACECELSGSSYCCTEPHCTFNLHKSCFDTPREVKHNSHLQHPLTLLTAPPYKDGFTCNACLKEGKAFAYNCAICSFDLHIDCVQWPDKVIRGDHKHSLTLYYSSPAADMGQDVTFVCDVCENPTHEQAWVYYCRECDFGTHLECIASAIKSESSGDGGAKAQEELITETELKVAMLQLMIGQQGRKNMLENI